MAPEGNKARRERYLTNVGGLMASEISAKHVDDVREGLAAFIKVFDELVDGNASGRFFPNGINKI